MSAHLYGYYLNLRNTLTEVGIAVCSLHIENFRAVEHLSIENLEVEQTGNETYDAARPITWYKQRLSYDDDNNDTTPEISISKFRSFYTALDHNSSDYNSNTNYRTLIKNAVLWALESAALSSKNLEFNQIKIVPNPVKDKFEIYLPSSTEYISAAIYNSLGQLILEDNLTTLNEGSGILEFDM